VDISLDLFIDIHRAVKVTWRKPSMASSQASQDPFEKLDQSVPNSFYWQLTLLATIGGFLFGYDTANIGSALNFVPYHLTGLALGYLVAGTSIGAAAGALAAGYLTDRFGRKAMLVIDAGIFAVGAILSAVTWDATVLLVARTLIGLAIGADSAIATAYIVEYAPQKQRGSLGMLQQWMITVGILVAYVIAIVILAVLPKQAYGLDWRLIFGLGAIPALIGLVLRTRMPESPRWLLAKGRLAEASASLRWLGIEATEEQLKQSAARLDRARDGKARTTRWTPGARRALMVVVMFFVFQQITGINIPFYYGPKLLAPLFGGANSSPVAAAIAGVEVTAIIALVNVAATYFAFRFIDRIGRRKLAIGGFAGMAVFMLVGAASLALTSGTAKIVLVTLALNLFVASFAVGVGGTGWLIQGEVFPTAIRGQAAAYGATADWLANFVLILLFPILQTGFGLAAVMLGFAALSIVAIAFVAGFLPETKGISVDEITEIFEKQADHRSVPIA
jgi:MFS transporter, SP family, arabinose:H+ symporter